MKFIFLVLHINQKLQVNQRMLKWKCNQISVIHYYFVPSIQGHDFTLAINLFIKFSLFSSKTKKRAVLECDALDYGLL